MKLKLKWEYANGEFDSKDVRLVAIPGRGRRAFGRDEMDCDIAIKDGMNFSISQVHLGDVDSSNYLGKEIVRRFNEFPSWRNCRKKPADMESVLVKTTRKLDPIRVAFYSYDNKAWYTEHGCMRKIRVKGWIPLSEIINLQRL